MGNEAASVAILYCKETPIKADYDVDKVTQQIALILPLQESTVLNGREKTFLLGKLFVGAVVFGCCAIQSVRNIIDL